MGMNDLLFQIISRDRTIAGRWQKAFQGEGWLVGVEASCLEGKPCRNPELDLLEVGTPDCRGHEELREIIAERRPLSTLVFGDPRVLSNRQIAALLDGGADDFFYKNLDERVLVAKLKAHLRRLAPALAKAVAVHVSSRGDLKLDRNSRAVTVSPSPGRQTEISNLTQKEFDILSLLVGHEQNVLTRETILQKLWGDCAENVYSECIDKHVESLRRKLGIFGKRIKTIYGTGYMFTSDMRP